MTNPVTIALSGLNAASTRVAAAASNIANATTTGAREGADGPPPYTPVDVVQVSTGTNTGEPQGTQTYTVERNPASTPLFQPDAPFADDNGLVAAPNVDYTREIVDTKMASLAYKANAKVIQVATDMERELIRSFDETA